MRGDGEDRSAALAPRRRDAGRLFLAITVLLLLPVVWVTASGQHEGMVNTVNGIAIKGYDPVAYHTRATPTTGSTAYEADWGGATWRFASAANRDLFMADPERYAPRYGGYCAWAAAQNKVAGADPERWTIHEGRLYLNFDARTERQFRRDLTGMISAADINWARLRAAQSVPARTPGAQPRN